MPTVLREGPYRFHFFSNEGTEPPHIHVRAGSHEAKFWLDPIQLAKTGQFSQRELHDIQRIIERHHKKLLEAWHGYFAP